MLVKCYQITFKICDHISRPRNSIHEQFVTWNVNRTKLLHYALILFLIIHLCQILHMLSQ